MCVTRGLFAQVDPYYLFRHPECLPNFAAIYGLELKKLSDVCASMAAQKDVQRQMGITREELEGRPATKARSATSTSGTCMCDHKRHGQAKPSPAKKPCLYSKSKSTIQTKSEGLIHGTKTTLSSSYRSGDRLGPPTLTPGSTLKRFREINAADVGPPPLRSRRAKTTQHCCASKPAHAICAGCQESVPKSNFSLSQWRKVCLCVDCDYCSNLLIIV